MPSTGTWNLFGRKLPGSRVNPEIPVLKICCNKKIIFKEGYLDLMSY